MQGQRIYAVDVFRGLTIGLMIIVNNPGSWSHIYTPLDHATWHGVTLADVVFPFFLFIVGMSIAIVQSRKELSSSAFWVQTMKRTMLLFLIGLVLNFSPFLQWSGDVLVLKPLSGLRIMGVLQRIALCYCCTVVIVRYLSWRQIVFFTAFLLVLYWGMCELLCKTQGDPYTLHNYFGLVWDLSIFQPHHLYQGEGVPFDPEGLASTIPAMTNTLMGYLVFSYFRKYRAYHRRLLYILLVAVIVGVVLWFGSDYTMPLNKKIWTSSYALYTACWATVWFIFLYFVYDIWDTKRNFIIKTIGYIANVMGVNALFLFILNGLLVRCISLFHWKVEVLVDDQIQVKEYTPWKYLFEQLISPHVVDMKEASLLCAMGMLLFMWMVAWVLYQRRIFVKV